MPLEMSYYEALGMPGWRTLQSVPTVRMVLDDFGFGEYFGVPDDHRVSEITIWCQALADRNADVSLLNSAGLWPEAPRKVPFICKRFADRSWTLPGRTSWLATTLTAPHKYGDAIAYIVALTPLLLLVVLALTCIIVARHLRGTFVRVSAPSTPISHRVIARSIQERMDSFDVTKDDKSGNKHAKMAAVRRAVEAACIHTLRSVLGAGLKLRDVGGSLTRNARLGKYLHVCFPNLSSADALKNCTTPKPENDVGYHAGQDCPLKGVPTFMTYVDFHLPVDALVKTITAPTLIITHDFTRIAGGEEWFDGECTVTRIGDFIKMHVEGGCDYFHGFHSWQQEGLVVSKSGAFSYQRVYDEHHTIVLWCVPVSGNFSPARDNTLRSSACHNARFQLNSGVTAALDGFAYRFEGPQMPPTEVDAATITRVAFQMSLVPRDEKWESNLNSVLRGRFTADKQDFLAIAPAAQLCVLLADLFAVTNRRSLVTNPATLSPFARFMYRLIINLTAHSPSVVQSLLSYLQDRALAVLSHRTRFTSWAWNDVPLPNYEIFWDQIAVKSVEANRRPKQPFRDAGEANPPRTPQQQGSAPSQDGRKPSRRNREAPARYRPSAPPCPDAEGPVAAPPVPGSAWTCPVRHPAQVSATVGGNGRPVAKRGAGHSHPKKGKGPVPTNPKGAQRRQPKGQHRMRPGKSNSSGRCPTPTIQRTHNDSPVNPAFLGAARESMAQASSASAV